MEIIDHPTVIVMGHSAMRRESIVQYSDYHGIAMSGPILELDKAVSGGTYTLDHLIEFAGRMCYRSWNKGRDHEAYIKNLLEQGHGSVFEHASINLAISGISRACSHELVRHRAGFAVSQESQRFVDASGVNCVVHPSLNRLDQGAMDEYRNSVERAIDTYAKLQDGRLGGKKETNQLARMVLPNAVETRLTWTGNLRSLRHFLEARGSASADPEIRTLAIQVARSVIPLAPHTFHDLRFDENNCISVTYHKI